MVGGLATRVSRALGSAPALAVAGVPLAAVASLGAAGVLPWPAILAARTVLAWTAAAVAVTAAAAAVALLDRRPCRALLAAAAACLLLHGVVLLAFRLDGVVDAGEGEEAPPWSELVAGPAARWVRGPDVRAVALPERRDAAARLWVGDREVSAPIGRPVRAGRLAVTVEDVLVAPAFVVRRKGGADEGAGYIKLVPGKRDWFEVALLPHRFYATTRRPPGDAVELASPIHLRVQRGKLAVLERDLRVGETAEFEGLAFAFGQGARWARIRVHRAAPPWLLVAAGALAGAALVVAAWRRRGAAP